MIPASAAYTDNQPSHRTVVSTRHGLAMDKRRPLFVSQKGPSFEGSASQRKELEQKGRRAFGGLRALDRSSQHVQNQRQFASDQQTIRSSTLHVNEVSSCTYTLWIPTVSASS
jgi:hypothetical protein